VASAPEDGTQDTTIQLSGWRYRALIWSVLLAAAGYLGFSLWAGWHDVADAVARVGMLGVLIALSLSLVNYALRFVRWQVYLRTMGHVVPNRVSLRIYLAGFAMTTTPGKAGEALRSVLLRRWRVPYPDSLAALVSERLSDLTAIVLLTLVGLATYPAMKPLVVVGGAVVLAVLLAISSSPAVMALRNALTGDSRTAVLLRHGLQVLAQARRCHAPALLLLALALSLVAWSAEAWALYLVLNWMGFDIPWAFAFFVYAISMLAGAASFMPGGLGGAEAAMVGLLVWKGVPGPDAVAATILVRLATLWFAVAIGCVALLRHQSNSDSPLRRS
jgi:uncharacterized protein (TIRG00374 family)